MPIASGSVLTVPAYPPVERLGVVGDRRAAAMIGPDGTACWLCLPNYDGDPVLGALLDTERGGLFRLGPATRNTGSQRYRDGTCTLLTRWDDGTGTLELEDFMVWPCENRKEGDARRRVLLRRLRCVQGRSKCWAEIRVRPDFAPPCAPALSAAGGWRLDPGRHDLGLWWSGATPLSLDRDTLNAEFVLSEGESVWAMLGSGEDPASWSDAAAATALEETEADWRTWSSKLTYFGPRRERVLRAAMTLRLLSHAENGAVVAAPTSSLPERVGGERNYDYRFAWVRDTSLALAILAMLGDLGTAERYMDWLAGLGSGTDMPLQVCYRLDGGTDLAERDRYDIEGYRGSAPVRFGNRAARQLQLDSLGYLNDCALVYLELGGKWKPEYSRMVRQAADYTARNWTRPDNGIWELDAADHYVSGKVMSWVALERASRIAERLGTDTGSLPSWRSAMHEIRAGVLREGWSDARGAFRQRYGAEALDASVLLIATMGFLPPEDARLRSTVERLEAELAVDGLLHRFRPNDLPEAARSDLSLAEFEGAFLPCCFWLATAHAQNGRPEAAEAILDRVDEAAGELGLLAEQMDARSGAFLGNTPLLFSHAEYLRAVIETAKARPLGRVKLMAGMAVREVRRVVGSMAGGDGVIADQPERRACRHP